MDLTSLMSALLSDDNLTSVSEKTGTTPMDTASVIAAVLPTLLSGANVQASTAETAQGFEQAAAEHAAREDEVSLEEGEKIVNHLLGEDADKTEKAIAKSTGLSKAKVILILAAAAPLLMKLLGNNSTANAGLFGGNNNSYYGNTGSLLGSLLGGSSSGLFGSSSSNSMSNALMGAALSSVLSGAMSGNTSSYGSNNSLLGSLLGSAVQPQVVAQPATSSSLLGSLLGASMNSAPAAQQQTQHTIVQATPQTTTQSSGFGLTDLLTSLLK